MQSRFISHLIRIPSVVSVALAIFLTIVTPFKAQNSEPHDMDPSVRPGDDFYRYANGRWLTRTHVPDGAASFDMRTILRKKTNERISEIIAAAAGAHARRGSNQQKVGDYYASVLDRHSIEAKGLQPFEEELAAVDAIVDTKTLSAYLGSTLNTEADGLIGNADHVFGLWVAQSFHDSRRNVPHLWQGGLGMDDRDSYLKDSPAASMERAKYQQRIANVLVRIGASDAERRAADVLALEVEIARSHAPDADASDPFKQDHPWQLKDFPIKAPGMDWEAYFKAAGIGDQPHVIVWQPSAAVGIAALVRSEPIDRWKDYLRFHRVQQYSSVLPAAFSGGGDLNLKQVALTATSAALGQAVGQLYMQQYFPAAAKAKVQAMVDGLIAAYSQRIQSVTWMSPATKKTALAKLRTLRLGAGYPEKWIDYSSLDIIHGDAVGNMRRAEKAQRERNLAQLKQAADPGEWRIDPQIFGAIIVFTPNSEFFGAGLLQPPFFDPDGDTASNYGSAGAGMAHEITHILDELGNVYDEEGRLTHWWSDQDRAAYQAAAGKLASQLSAACPFPDACVNGKQVLGESSADLAGLEVAHDAYVRSVKGRPDTVIGGLTGEQRFFIAFAQRWKMVQTDAALRDQLAKDTHAPAEYRSDLVRNVDAWYAAFGVVPGDKLYLAPDQRVHVW